MSATDDPCKWCKQQLLPTGLGATVCVTCDGVEVRAPCGCVHLYAPRVAQLVACATHRGPHVAA